MKKLTSKRFIANSIHVLFLRLAHMLVSWKFKNKKVFVVCGMRRSGNHAFINWLLNALEETETSFEELKGDRVSVSESEKSIFFNEANFYGLKFFLKLIFESKQAISNASNVIISIEDYVPRGKYDPYFPHKATTVVIKRSTLNLVASRLKRAIDQAQKGKDRGDMAIDEPFFSKLNWIYSQSEGTGYCCWSFDDWLVNKNSYRQRFLKKFELKFDATPQMSTQGGGSSFSGQSKIPTPSEMQARWSEIDWPQRVLKLAKRNCSLLNEDESVFISDKLSEN
ncbi:hypothetical protein AWH61_05105 [Alteromonas sp. W12]|uniref:hypothetical protein n=1 Tax=Alteromonas sp. W12 TaxID=1772289 RepID=UPI000948C1C6|nr:hypothetical protein [Alteromonas sp. W12]OLF79226.1 hypothetical protein AWH61_05105 [Alteromonas sp. W12]